MAYFKDESLAFPAAEGLSLSQTETPFLFYLRGHLYYSPIYTFSKSISISPKHPKLPKGQWQMQILNLQISQCAGFFPAKFCIGFAPLGLSQTRLTLRATRKTKGGSRLGALEPDQV